jgi:hypothetical protein
LFFSSLFQHQAWGEYGFARPIKFFFAFSPLLKHSFGIKTDRLGNILPGLTKMKL